MLQISLQHLFFYIFKVKLYSCTARFSCLANAQSKQSSSVPLHKNTQDKEFTHNEKQIITTADRFAKQFLQEEIKKNNDPINGIQIREMITSFFKNDEQKVKKYKNDDRIQTWFVSYKLTGDRLEITMDDKNLQLISIRHIPTARE